MEGNGQDKENEKDNVKQKKLSEEEGRVWWCVLKTERHKGRRKEKISENTKSEIKRV